MKCTEATDTAFTTKEQNELVSRVLSVREQNELASPKVVTAMALQLKDQISCSIDASKRKRLMQSRFDKDLVCAFVSTDADQLSNKVSRLVGYVGFAFFYSISVFHFLRSSQFSIACKTFEDQNKSKNLDEIGFTPCQDLILKNKRVYLQASITGALFLRVQL